MHTTGSIAKAVGGRLVGPTDLTIADLAAMDQAGARSLTFMRDRAYAKRWPQSTGAAALVSEGLEVPGHDEKTRALIFVTDADLAMVKVLQMFEVKPQMPPAGVHATAVVDPTASIGNGARIGPFCLVGARSVIGDGAALMSRVTLGADVNIGPGSTLHPGVVVYDRCSIGAQTILHANVCIGADGFGYRPDPSGAGLIKIPHIGTVKIGNGVEIGAGSCVDRGKFGATTVGDGTKIDNLVQVGHNVQIGRCVILCGMAGLAGSATVGDGAIIGGGVGIADNIRIGSKAQIGAMSAVMSDIPEGEVWTGTPAMPHKDFLRSRAAARKLPDVLRTLKSARGHEGNGSGPG